MRFPEFNKKHVSLAVSIMIMLLVCVAGVAVASSGGEAGGDSHGWAKTDWFRVMNFTALVIILVYFARKPLSEMLNGRIKGIKEELEGLEAKKKEAEEKLAGYNERIASLEQEAEKIIAEYIAQGEAARKRILEESEKAAEKLEEQAKRNIEHEFQNAKTKLQKDIMEKALAKAEGLIKEKITSTDQDRLVDEYLNKVVVQ